MEFLEDWYHRLGLGMLLQSSGKAFAVFLAASIVVVFFELRSGVRLAKYRSKIFLNDVIYSVYYRGGFHRVFVFAAIANALEDQLGFMRLDLLETMPFYAALVIYWIVGDFFLYWAHRLLHASPMLWAFHSVHHAETELNTLSQTHRHPVDAVVHGLALYLPLAFFLGLPTALWIPWYLVAQMLEALQHGELNWRFGPLYKVVVSPVFHSIHHSDHPADRDRNFGAMFSVWDYLFGTAAKNDSRPTSYGIKGHEIPDSIPVQILKPFKLMWTRQGPIAAEKGEADSQAR